MIAAGSAPSVSGKGHNAPRKTIDIRQNIIVIGKLAPFISKRRGGIIMFDKHAAVRPTPRPRAVTRTGKSS